MPRTTIRSEDVTDAQIKTADMAVDPTNASNLSSGSVPLAQLGNAPPTDLDPVEDDIAVLGFQVAAASDLAQFNLRDQTVNTFQDATGIDASASVNESRNSTGKYWSGSADVINTAENFTTVGAGTWSAPAGLSSFRLLVVGGGGGTSTNGWTSGGGGGGGVVYIADWDYAGGATVNFSVGGGAAGQAYPPTTQGVAGTDSVWDSGSLHQTITGVGGGFSAYHASANPPSTGGSGGGGCAHATASWRLGGASSQPADFGSYTGVGHGYRGGNTWSPGASYYVSAGGGGAGGIGGDISTNQYGSHGGQGYDASAVFGTSVGDAGWFGGGGGGAGHAGRSGEGGAGSNNNGSAGGYFGGGGTGDNHVGTNLGTSGLANTGGGAGGTRNDYGPGHAGGSGAIHIIYDYEQALNMTLVSTSTTAEAGTTATGDFVILYTPQVGTTTLNTDLIASVSRDNGTTYTVANLVGKGSYSGTTQIATAHGIDISGQPAGVAMRWKIATLNQSAAKETRLNGVSLGWA